MTELPRTYKRPIHELAAIIYRATPDGYGMTLDEAQMYASKILDRLRELGFISELGYAAIRAEEDANGWEHKVLPRYAPPAEPETR